VQTAVLTEQNKALFLVLEEKSSFICRVSNHNQSKLL